ncbi:unnamed protein product, partial [Effrenium voratum]
DSRLCKSEEGRVWRVWGVATASRDIPRLWSMARRLQRVRAAQGPRLCHGLPADTDDLKQPTRTACGRRRPRKFLRRELDELQGARARAKVKLDQKGAPLRRK